MPFVGRQRELAALDEVLAATAAGTGRVVLITGEAGIGKTGLADASCLAARARGLQVAWGRAWDGAPAFGPWIDVWRSLFGEDGPFGRAPPGEQTAAAARGAQFAVAAERLIATARERPLAIVLDDVDAADAASLLLALALGSQAETAPLAIVATCRSADGGRRDDGAAELLARLARAALVVPLAGLEPAIVAELVAWRTGAPPGPPVIEALLAATGGNPFLLDAVIGALGSIPAPAVPLTPRIRDTVTARLGRLPGEARAVVDAAAVVGRPVSMALLELITDLPTSELLPALDICAAERLLVAAPGEVDIYGFPHALVRDAVLAALDEVGRLDLHRRVGEALEILHEGDLEPHLDELARHVVAAAALVGADPGIEASCAAAARATACLAYEQAVAHYRRALCLATATSPRRRAELAIRLGDALVAAATAGATRIDPGWAGVLREALTGLPDSERELRARVVAGIAALEAGPREA